MSFNPSIWDAVCDSGNLGAAYARYRRYRGIWAPGEPMWRAAANPVIPMLALAEQLRQGRTGRTRRNALPSPKRTAKPANCKSTRSATALRSAPCCRYCRRVPRRPCRHVPTLTGRVVAWRMRWRTYRVYSMQVYPGWSMPISNNVSIPSRALCC